LGVPILCRTPVICRQKKIAGFENLFKKQYKNFEDFRQKVNPLSSISVPRPRLGKSIAVFFVEENSLFHSPKLTESPMGLCYIAAV